MISFIIFIYITYCLNMNSNYPKCSQNNNMKPCLDRIRLLRTHPVFVFQVTDVTLLNCPPDVVTVRENGGVIKVGTIDDPATS